MLGEQRGPHLLARHGTADVPGVGGLGPRRRTEAREGDAVRQRNSGDAMQGDLQTLTLGQTTLTQNEFLTLRRESNTRRQRMSLGSHRPVNTMDRQGTTTSLPGQMQGALGKYRPTRKLGAGQFGTCWEVIDDAEGGVKRVLKQIFVGMLAPDETADALKEAKLLANLRHANVLALHEAFIHDRQFVCIVCELCEGGDLSKMIEDTKFNGNVLPERQIMGWFVQLLLALSYLHVRKVLHRDVKSKNVFLQRGLVKLGDFGIARVLQSTADAASTLAGTPYYMSPESLSGLGYNAKSDIWALGCIIFELCLLKMAFDGDNLLGLTYKICEGSIPELPDRYSASLREISASLLVRDPSERPSALALLQNPFVLEHTRNLDSDLSKSQISRESNRIRQAVPDMMGKQHRRQNRSKSPTANQGGNHHPLTVQTMGSTNSSQGTMNYTSGSGTASSNGATLQNLTPRQKMEMRKRQEADARAHELGSAAGGSYHASASQRQQNRGRDRQANQDMDSALGSTSRSYQSVREESSVSQRSRESVTTKRSRERSDMSQHSRHVADDQIHGHGHHGQQHQHQHQQQHVPPWVQEHPEIFPDGTPMTSTQLDFNDSGGYGGSGNGSSNPTANPNQFGGGPNVYRSENSSLSRSGHSHGHGHSRSNDEMHDLRSDIARQLSGANNNQVVDESFGDPPLQAHSPTQLDASLTSLHLESSLRLASFSQGPEKQSSITPQQLNINKIRGLAQRSLGEADFNKVYKYIQKARAKAKPDEEIAEGFAKIMKHNPDNIRHCNLVDQLVFLETLQKKATKANTAPNLYPEHQGNQKARPGSRPVHGRGHNQKAEQDNSKSSSCNIL